LFNRLTSAPVRGRVKNANGPHIKDPEAERLAAEVAALAGETKTAAVRVALRERLERLHASAAAEDPVHRLRRFLMDEAWPQIPVELRGGLTKREREAILGYGPEGV
jgi:antitoxin VapB